MATQTRLKIRNNEELHVFNTLNEKLSEIGFTNVIWIRKTRSWGGSGVGSVWGFKSSKDKIQLNMADISGNEGIEWALEAAKKIRNK